MRLALAQLNPLVGDLQGNARDIAVAYREAVAAGADLVVAGELGLTGYPPEDLLLRPAFLAAVDDHLRQLAAQTGDAALVVGFPEGLPPPHAHPPLANSAAVLRAGAIEAVYRKQRIPNYGVFDEARYFRPGDEAVVIDVGDMSVGVTVCEDLWADNGPVAASAAAGAQMALSLNASPYHRGKRDDREHWAARHARRSDVWIAYLNVVGGQDEIVFDGDSFVMGPDGAVVARARQFEPDLLLVDLPEGGAPSSAPRLEPVAEVYAALVLATRDYARKNGFDRALVGVSGGVDSSLVATIATDALGAGSVTGVAMPSPYSSEGSLRDAEKLAANLGINHLELPISEVMAAFDAALAEPFAGTEPGVAEENIQSRIRGTLLMALSNKFGDLVLTTGNKSEMAVGYATLYGDMAGGFAVIKDVPKLLVYELCRHRNAEAGFDLVPEAVLKKPPSAELRPGQRDTDALPPYDVLDPILEAYVEQDQPVEAIMEAGYDETLVRRITRMVDDAEYKRRQAPPGPKITRRAFGRDRRPPITQGWQE
jgi:NAD+ synthase (glutamine-hydrolysing)